MVTICLPSEADHIRIVRMGKASIMQREFRVVLGVVGLIAPSVLLSSCGLFDRRVAGSKPVARAVVAPPRAAAVGGATPSEAVWGLRSGLNVAALSCRGQGRRAVAGDYARMLARHRGLLAAAYRQEQGRQGAGAFDRAQTRVYNTFANQTSPVRFCSAASQVAQRANGLDSAAFAVAAPRLLGELKASLRYRP
jgi:hypothetical protein